MQGALALNHLARGMPGRAVFEAERAVELSGRHPLQLAFLALSHAAAGDRERARELLEELLSAPEETYVDPILIAVVYIGLEQWDAAFEWSERAFHERSPGFLYSKVAPFLDPIRGRHRFEALLLPEGRATRLHPRRRRCLSPRRGRTVLASPVRRGVRG